MIPPDLADADDRVSHVLEFMSRPVASNAEGELMTLRLHLAELAALPVSINQFHRILDLFQARIDGLWSTAMKRLSVARRPLANEIVGLAESLDDIEAQVFDGYLRVLRDVEQRLVRNRRRDPALVAGRALKALRDRLILAAYLSRAAPRELWSEAHRLFGLACGDRPFDQTQALGERDARRIYREMLAFSTAQPERLSGPEIAAAADYVARYAPTVVVLDAAPEQMDYRLFWFAAQFDMAPVAIARRIPDPRAEIVYFSCERMGTLAVEHARALEEGATPASLLLPPGMDTPRLRALLQRLHETWAEPPTRHLMRRRQHYQVQMVIGLPAIAQRLENPNEDGLSLWDVRDESPAGYALTHHSGQIGSLTPGEVVAIRGDAAKPWDICVVRRALAQGTGPAQVGLQVLGSGARAVKIAFRHVNAEGNTAHQVLWLPALPVIRSRNAILVPTGIAGSTRFVMVSSNGRTQVTQGRIVSQDLQTATIEVFQFEDDPYPI
ncbi:MAG: hypothetical protein WBP72_06925 [Rhodocyclaceae bacterium]